MIDYHLNEKNPWKITEKAFDERYLAKFESIFAQGNGKLGIRAALDETYVNETRNTFIAGTFNKAFPNEVTELPNVMDMTRFDIYIDDKRFSLLEGRVKNYQRTLHLQTGELTRSFEWTSPENKTIRFAFRRFVSLHDLFLFAQKLELELIDGASVKLKIRTGIDGSMTNSGSQHLYEEKKRLHDQTIMQYVGRTNQSDVRILANTALNIFNSGLNVTDAKTFAFDRRQASFIYETTLKEENPLILEKLNTLHTSRDQALEALDLKAQTAFTKDAMNTLLKDDYATHLENSVGEWKKIWANNAITIKSETPFDQLALRFAQYHLNIMTPKHDSRMQIGAKGLSGEGYKGHTFWDSDIFILPYWLYTEPSVARGLLEYRYHSLKGARKKAQENGYDGAMYPWESAWIDDGEVTPETGGTNVITGEPEKIITGHKEIHITGDVVYAVWHYYNMTGDDDFMEKMGYEIIFESARFWASRLEWNQERNRYEITDVIGPDEYKENIDNNFYTNTLANFTIELALKLYQERQGVIRTLTDKRSLETLYKQLSKIQGKIYVPEPDKNNIIPQDDTYCHLPEIDLTPYKASDNVGAISHDYNMAQITKLKVSKQADVMVAFLLFKDLHDHEVKQANFDYYEPYCLHDSSLSLSTYAIMAKELGYMEKAYDLFKKSSTIDLGTNMTSSDTGIHSASLGGIWQSVVLGFAGIRHDFNALTIEPELPDAWEALEVTYTYKDKPLRLIITKETLKLESQTDTTITLKIYGKTYRFTRMLQVEMR